MRRHSFFSYNGKVIISLILEIIYFPIWWYSVGLFRLTQNIISFLYSRERTLGFSIWLKNIFVPMYGQWDFSGRLISFFIRLVQIIYRGIVLLFWVTVCLFILLFWLAIPIVLVLLIFFQILK